jgi:glutamate racemase
MTLLRHAAPELVEAAEAKMRGEAVDPSVYTRAMAGLTEQAGGARLDVTVLGCTHFPLVEDELRAVAPHMRFVDGAAGIARHISYLTHGQPWPDTAAEGTFVTTGSVNALESLRPALSDFGLSQIKSL